MKKLFALLFFTFVGLMVSKAQQSIEFLTPITPIASSKTIMANIKDSLYASFPIHIVPQSNTKFGSNSRGITQVLDSITRNSINTNGNLLTIDKHSYSYDNHGNVTNHTTYNYDDGLVFDSKIESNFDFIGNQIRQSQYDWDTTLNMWIGDSKYEMTYNSNNQITKQLSFFWDYSSNSWYQSTRFDFEYNSNNLLISEKIYSNAVNGWVKSVDVEYEYNVNQKRTSFVILWLDPSTQQLERASKSEYIYDSNDSLVTESFSSKTENNPWITTRKYTFQYNQNGYLTYKSTHGLNSTTNLLEIETSTEYSYDSNANLIEEKEIVWEGATTAPWRLANIKSYSYDLNNQLIERLLSYWNVANLTWYTLSKTITTYDFNGYQNSSLSFHWDTTLNQWDSTFKYFRTYDFNGNILQYEYYTWEKNSSKWKGGVKYDQEFNVNDLNTSFTNYVWDYSNWQWLKTYKDSISYDTLKNLTQKVTKLWDSTSGSWLIFYKFEYNYNNAYSFDDLFVPKDYLYSGMLLSEQYYKFNTVTSSWDSTNSIIYHFSTQNINSVPEISKNNLTVYPNPFTNFITFKNTDFVGKMELKIFNIQGQRIISSTLTNNQKISTEKLRSGIYIYSLDANGEIWKGKLIKQ